MKILITGADGFVGRNLIARLQEHKGLETLSFTRESSDSQLREYVEQAEFIYHLAGVNRPVDSADFETDNARLTQRLCGLIEQSSRKIPVVYTSSIQAEKDNAYGRSKRDAELALESLGKKRGGGVNIFRLPNVFGKWCRPNYNSVIATFCYNISRGLPIQINDPTTLLTLVYIDDVVDRFIELLRLPVQEDIYLEVTPQYTTTVGEIAEYISSFRRSRETLVTERVGTGLMRAIYATYVSYLPPRTFSYPIPQHSDSRGMFVEMLKTQDSGQFSYFTAHPGITRGGHFHHSKTEKFLVVKGRARFGFRHTVTNEYYAIETCGSNPEIVETVPGWTHDVTNIGEEEMIVMLWANEIFDRAHPDTFARPVNHEEA
jgi:UDP-2-acetamido-2,6-beta-L-arabino-hexul-4-ose reductase